MPLLPPSAEPHAQCRVSHARFVEWAFHFWLGRLGPVRWGTQDQSRRNSIMKRIFVAVLAATLVAGLVPASAAGAHGGGGGGGGMRAVGFRGLGLRAPGPGVRVPHIQNP